MASPLDEPQQQVDPVTGRVITSPATTAPSNAEQPETQANSWYDGGLEEPTRTLEQTQSIKQDNTAGLSVIAEDGTVSNLRRNPETGELYDPAGLPATGYASTPDQNVAVSAPDDGVQPNPVSTQAAVNAIGSGSSYIVNAQPNVLDQYGSYTYNASVYLLSDQEYNQLIKNKQASQQVNVAGYQLLFQSGGAGLSTQDIRNPWFTEDFYIDHITLENLLPGRAVGASHMVSSLKFTVVEPANITLLDRMYAAVQDHVARGKSGAINYASVVYLMVIRFYGYDQNGNLVRATANSQTTGKSGAIVEKFIPFFINTVNWSVGNKLVSYDFDCSPIGQQVGATINRGTIPFDVEFSAATVKELLSGTLAYSTTSANPATPGNSTTATAPYTYADYDIPVTVPAPDKVSTVPNKKASTATGLMSALNEFQQEKVKAGEYTIADEFYIEFLDSQIASATVVLPGSDKNKAATPMAQPTTQNTKGLVNQPQTDHSIRNVPFTAGQQIVQAIELTIRNSSYITSQANAIKNEEQGIQEANTNANVNKPLDWFLITIDAQQKGYDTKRNDWAYKITYKISRYKIPNFDSRYFALPVFPGVHKSYPYWFTGQNTAVLDYQANFNALYTQTVTGSDPKKPGEYDIRKKLTSSMRDLPKYNALSASAESRIGAKNQGNEIGANASEYLLDVANLGESKMRIIGDPAWIQQGSLVAGLAATGGPFLADGTINFDAMQVLYEIAWQRPEDYSLLTGIADPYSRTQKTTGDRQPIQSFVYQATRVISEFNRGKFEQTLEGLLYTLPKPDGSNTAPTAPNTGAALTGSGAGSAAYAAVDPRRVDNPITGGLNSLTGGALRAGQSAASGAASAVQNTLSTVKGAVSAPGTSETQILPNAGTSADSVGPAIAPASPAEPVTSNGEATVADFYYGEPPLKIGEDNSPTNEPTQNIVWEP